MPPGGYGDDSSQPTTSSVLKREVPWQTYLTARLISDRDLHLIRGYDKKDLDTKKEALKQVHPYREWDAGVRVECSTLAQVKQLRALSH